MTDAGAEAMDSDVPGACVRVGEQTIQLMQLSTPDPFDVDPTYSMSAPPPGTTSAPRRSSIVLVPWYVRSSPNPYPKSNPSPSTLTLTLTLVLVP